MKYRVIRIWDVHTSRYWYKIEVPFLWFFWVYVPGTICLSQKDAEDRFFRIRAKQADEGEVIKYGETK